MGGALAPWHPLQWLVPQWPGRERDFGITALLTKWAESAGKGLMAEKKERTDKGLTGWAAIDEIKAAATKPNKRVLCKTQ